MRGVKTRNSPIAEYEPSSHSGSLNKDMCCLVMQVTASCIRLDSLQHLCHTHSLLARIATVVSFCANKLSPPMLYAAPPPPTLRFPLVRSLAAQLRLQKNSSKADKQCRERRDVHRLLCALMHKHAPKSFSMTAHICAFTRREREGEREREATNSPVGFLFFLRLLPQRHCSICDPLLKMLFQINRMDLAETGEEEEEVAGEEKEEEEEVGDERRSGCGSLKFTHRMGADPPPCLHASRAGQLLGSVRRCFAPPICTIDKNKSR